MLDIQKLLQLLKKQRGFDFSGYRSSMLERRIQKRVYTTQCNDLNDYLDYVQEHDEELENLIDVFTINVSHFFRNSLCFEILQKVIIQELVLSKKSEGNSQLRIWSAGCSYGEEPYSIAMIIKDYLKNENLQIETQIFATDIDKKALIRANDGFYDNSSLRSVKYRMIQKYFTQINDGFLLSPLIKDMVQFSFHDLLDKNKSVPQDSIYGSFDIVFCRNVLIYFEPEFQKIIFNKLYNSLIKNGYLILGEAETPVDGYKHKFCRESKYCKIYRKSG